MLLFDQNIVFKRLRRTLHVTQTGRFDNNVRKIFRFKTILIKLVHKNMSIV